MLPLLPTYASFSKESNEHRQKSHNHVPIKQNVEASPCYHTYPKIFYTFHPPNSRGDKSVPPSLTSLHSLPPSLPPPFLPLSLPPSLSPLPPHSRGDKSVPDVVMVLDATRKQSLGAVEDIDQQALLSFDKRYPLVIDEGHDSLGNEKSNSVSGAS